MKLKEEHYEVIETMAATNYAPRRIALYMGISEKKFMKEWYDESSLIRYHYERGKLKGQFDISKKLLENATAGNLTAIQQYQKEVDQRRVEDVKERILYCQTQEQTPDETEPKKIART